MPSKSKSQHYLMEAIARDPEYAKQVGLSQKVAREYLAADRRSGKFSHAPNKEEY